MAGAEPGGCAEEAEKQLNGELLPLPADAEEREGAAGPGGEEGARKKRKKKKKGKGGPAGRARAGVVPCWGRASEVGGSPALGGRQ